MSLRTRRTGTGTHPTTMGSQRHKYYNQEDGSVAMHSLHKKPNQYNANVTASARSVPSDDDLSAKDKVEFDFGEDTVPLKGIKRTVDITVK